MRSILIVEIVSGDVHRLARRLGGGDPGLVAHQLIEIGPDLRLHIGGNIGIFLQILLGGVPALTDADLALQM